MTVGSSPDERAGPDWDAIFSSDTEDEDAGAKLRAKAKDAEKCKEQGNSFLQGGDLAKAVAAYKRGLRCVWAPYRQRSDAASAQLGVVLDLNLALCHLRLEDWTAAHQCAARAVVAEPKSAKGLYRRGVAAARLELFDAAEADLAAAATLQKGGSAEILRELSDVREKRKQQRKRESTSGVMSPGFLQGANQNDSAASKEHDVGKPADGSLSERNTGQQQQQQQKCEHVVAEDQLEPVAGSEVLAALQDVTGLLEAIAARRIICSSTEELLAIRQQIDHAAAQLPVANTAVEAAVVEQPLGPNPEIRGCVEIEALLELMAQGLPTFRPFFSLRETRPGEFDGLRICRELPGTCRQPSGSSRGYDLELVRMGEVGLATPEDVAELLFPPTGRPPDASAAAWQRQAFFRVFQKDASKFVNVAAVLLLLELAAGADMRFHGRRVLDLGLAHGIFFGHLTPEGPMPQQVATHRAHGVGATSVKVQDAMAVCSGADKRLLVVPSFASLGLVHTWLLLKVEAKVDGEPPCEVAGDLCGGSLGLLSLTAPDSKLARTWEASCDDRFIPRYVCWGEESLSLAQCPEVLSEKGARLQRAAFNAMLKGLPQLSLSSESAFEQLTMACKAAAGSRESSSWDPSVDANGRREALHRLRRAAAHLGLPLSCCGGATDSLATTAWEVEAPSSEELEAAQQTAIEALTQRRLQAAGLFKGT